MKPKKWIEWGEIFQIFDNLKYIFNHEAHNIVSDAGKEVLRNMNDKPKTIKSFTNRDEHIIRDVFKKNSDCYSDQGNPAMTEDGFNKSIQELRKTFNIPKPKPWKNM